MLPYRAHLRCTAGNNATTIASLGNSAATTATTVGATTATTRIPLPPTMGAAAGADAATIPTPASTTVAATVPVRKATSAPQDTQDESGQGGQGGAIAGGVVGAVAVGCLIGLAVFLYTRRAGATLQDEGGVRGDADGEVALDPGEQPPDQRKHYNRAPEYVPQHAAMLAAVRPARAT